MMVITTCKPSVLPISHFCFPQAHINLVLKEAISLFPIPNTHSANFSHVFHSESISGKTLQEINEICIIQVVFIKQIVRQSPITQNYRKQKFHCKCTSAQGQIGPPNHQGIWKINIGSYKMSGQFTKNLWNEPKASVINNTLNDCKSKIMLIM